MNTPRSQRPQKHWRPWTLEEAVTFIRALEEPLRLAGWGIGLTGSVLFRGSSSKDLDIIVYPLTSNANREPEDVYEVLKAYPRRMTRLRTKEQLHEIWREKGSDDEKHVESWTIDHVLRVDIFFLR